jgi:hypothetical protein
MIKINTRSDPRISEAFPNDPYSNLCILTATQTLNLQQAFLSMDSEYFSQVDPDTREVDLRDLKEDPLIRVMHSLYGEELVLNSMGELTEIFPIVVYLGIEDYRKTIEEELLQKRELLEHLEFLELSYKFKFLWTEVLGLHMENKLRLLEESKNYLQLAKIEDETFNVVLLEFLSRYGEGECKILNNVMENYFNRKSIKPMVYLRNPALSRLMQVWLKYHHVPAAELVIKSTPNILEDDEENRSRTRTEALFRRASDETTLELKRKQIVELEKEIFFKDNFISDLSTQIHKLKKELGLKEDVKLTVGRSLLIDFDTELSPNMKKNPRFQELSP